MLLNKCDLLPHLGSTPISPSNTHRINPRLQVIASRQLAAV
jgi:hypothetical protein